VIPETVEVDFFDPNKYEPFNLSLIDGENYQDYFKFLSIFKWETRKGWDILLKVFFFFFFFLK